MTRLFPCIGLALLLAIWGPQAVAQDQDQIRAVQTELAERGLYTGMIDGLTGPLTRQGILVLQNEAGLPETGEIDAQVLSLLGLLAQNSPVPGQIVGFVECADCPEMILIPGGTFTMGSPASEQGRDDDEGPQQEQMLAPFALARTETTFDQWQTCVRGGGCQAHPAPSDSGWGRGERPVIDVSWDDAQDFVAWLNAAAGVDAYRLPSEAEWEFAARAGASGALTTPAPGEGNFGAMACCAAQKSRDDPYLGTAPVGAFPANAFRLQDMAGNVWEWVEDCWHAALIPAGAFGPAEPDCAARVRRGGSWYYPADRARPANRSRLPPDTRDSENGFRVARSLPPGDYGAPSPASAVTGTGGASQPELSTGTPRRVSGQASE